MSQDLSAAVASLRALLADEVDPCLETAPSLCDDATLERFLLAAKLCPKDARKRLLAFRKWHAQEGWDRVALPPAPGAPLLVPVRGHRFLADSNVDFSHYLQAQDVTAPSPSSDTADTWSESSAVYSPSSVQAMLHFYLQLGGGCFHKHDREGRPVYIERLGQHNAKTLSSVRPEIAARYHILGNELILRRLTGNPGAPASNGKMVCIVDCQGMGLHQLHWKALQLIRHLADLDQRYYPELVETIYIVHAPSIFARFWGIVRHWLDARVQAKVQMLTRSSDLLQQIPSENLPQEWGGSCTCQHMQGGCVPTPQQQLSHDLGVPAPSHAMDHTGVLNLLQQQNHQQNHHQQNQQNQQQNNDSHRKKQKDHENLSEE